MNRRRKSGPLVTGEFLFIIDAFLFALAIVIWPVLSPVVDFVRGQGAKAFAIMVVLIGAVAAAAMVRSLRQAMLQRIRSSIGWKILLGVGLFLLVFDIYGFFHGRGAVIVVGGFDLRLPPGVAAVNPTLDNIKEQFQRQIQRDVIDVINNIGGDDSGERYPAVSGERVFSVATFDKARKEGLGTFKLWELKRTAVGAAGEMEELVKNKELRLHILVDSTFGISGGPTKQIQKRTWNEIVASAAARILKAAGLELTQEMNTRLDSLERGEKMESLSRVWRVEAEFADDRDARGLLLKESYQKKIKRYIALIESDPNRALYHYYLGIAYIYGGFPKQAEESLKRASQLSKALRSKVQFQIAKHYYYAGWFEQAKIALERFLDMEPGDKLGNAKLGVATWRAAMQRAQQEPRRHFNRTNYRKVIEKAEKLLKSALKLGQANMHLAQLYTHIGEFNKADNFYKKALQTVDPDTSQFVYYLFAESLRARGNFATARKYYEKTLKPNTVKTPGGCKVQEGNYYFHEIVVDNKRFCMTRDFYFSNVEVLAKYFQNLIDQQTDEGSRLEQARKSVKVLSEVKEKLSQKRIRIVPETHAALLDVLGYALLISGEIIEAKRMLESALQLESDANFAIWEGDTRYHLSLWLIKSTRSSTESWRQGVLKYLSEANKLSIEGSWMRKETESLMARLL